ncbi:PREDICTED: B-cell CLL/lymphoma 9-like protein [Gekko japonicus]|uniref:B-cell CLL/lymphoma 9-like protein n=1 Tax=Gekko japonicus TaxID=146911 RepID=A0ABM1LC54_GEKJA|nr:PREDICTED: B-cell CLL/lymphoma 9-like protein [Gekko japonicus]
MHPDSKLTNHGKTGSSSAQPQPHNVSQGPACHLGAKGVGAGNHGGKVGQPPPGNSGLKPTPAPLPVFGALKGKVKRERSVSVDSGERREVRAASLDKELKEVAPRSKRRCVLERKQPYSGDEWCSGPDSEEDEKALGGSSHNCNVAESAMTAASQLGTGPNALPALSESNASGTPHSAAPGLRSEAGSGGGKQPLQVVYVFTTHLANTAAEAVLQGRADSILGYHQQHVPRAKLDQVPASKLPAVPEPLPMSPSPASTPQSQTAMPPSSQGQPPPHVPPPAPPPASAPLGLGQGPLPPASTLPPEGAADDARRDLTPNSVGNGGGGGGTAPSGTCPNTPPAPGSLPGSAADSLLGEGATPGGAPSAGNGPRHPLSTEGLSKEQLEHRERSLQTLRDIERLLLRSSGEAEPFLKGAPGSSEGGLLPPQAPPPQPPAPPPGAGMKKYEEPLQSMISQTQSLGGPGLEQEGAVPPGVDMGQQMNMMMQRLGQDSLTPEQVAWRKLQEEYYEEKRRKEEQVGMHGGRPLPEMLLPPQPMSGMVLRGPPPPYHSKPGEQWLLRSLPGEPLQEPLQMRPPFAGPRFPGSQMQRGFGGMQNMPPLEALGPLSTMQRPARPGITWSEEMPMGGPGNFAPANLPYPPGQGEAERFLTPRAREEILRQQLLEKRQSGMQRPLGAEMERIMQAHRQVEPALFASEALGLEFGGARAVLSPPLRDMEPSLGPGNLNMNMNVNMNMNLNVQMAPQQQQQQQMLLSQKLRGPELVPSEDVARARAPSGNGAMLGGPHKMLMGSPFPGPGQPGFSSGGQGPYPAMSQEMGSAQEMFGPAGSTTRLSHIPLPPTTHAPSTNMPQAPARGLCRRPSDLALNMGPMNSPGVGRLKSPTLSQVHSPLGTSPSANLKSPQTPSSAMVNLPAASAPGGPLGSPQVLSSVLSARSPASSPGHLKSPSMAASSPGWAPSPKNALSSPAMGQSKPAIGMSNSAPLGNIEQDPPPSQNPLSLMMSQMSKYALPSSTPLYHNAIKTIATSDDELLPDRPMLPPGAMAAGVGSGQSGQLHMNSVGVPPAPSPLALSLPGQQPLSHEPPAPNMSSPSPLGSNLPMHSGAPTPMMLPPGAQDSLGQPCGPPGQLVFPARLQQPPANGGSLPGAGGPSMPQQQHYAPGLGLPPEELPPPQPGPMVPPQRMGGRMPEPYPPVLPGVASVLNDPELSDVIRPTPTGIPEFDLSRIIPSEKPSSTLQYFPKGDGQPPPKAQPPSNLHLMNLQNMMVEQGPPARPGPQGMMPRSMALCHPGQVPVLGRTGLAPQQAMMGNSMHQGMMLPQQNLMAQQNFLLMQAKQRSMSVSGEMYAPPGHLLSPQGSLMGPPPQQSLMVSHPMRQRSVSLDSQMSYGGPGAGSMANLPF